MFNTGDKIKKLMQWSLATGLALSAALASAQGDAFPVKPIQVIITSTPGSGLDSITRTLGVEFQKALGQPLVVVSKANASGTIGADFVKRAAPDGYTIFFGGNTSMAANVFLVKNMSYDPLRDFEPVSQVSINPLLPGGAERPADQVGHRAGELCEGPSGRDELRRRQLRRQGGGAAAAIDHRHEGPGDLVNGASQAALELVAGRLDFMIVDPVVVDGFLKNGQLRPLAVSSSIRLPSMPEIPT